METYLEAIPTELTALIFDYLNEYKDIIHLIKVVKDYIQYNSTFFENLFRSTYPLIYPDVSKVIQDDKYLNNNYHKLSNYAVLYAMFKDSYTNLNLQIIEESELSVPDTDIISRAIFNKRYQGVYSKIKQLESFNFDGFNKWLRNGKFEPYILINYWNHGLYWYLFLRIFRESDSNIYYHINIISDLYDNLYDNLLEQDKYLEILEVLMEDKNIRNLIVDSTSMESIVEMIHNYYLCKPDEISMKQQELFKFIYKNKIGPTEDYTWRYLLRTIENNNYDLFIWLLNNGENTWVNNSEFENTYQEIKDEREDKNYDLYDIVLQKFKLQKLDLK